ncbi:hypothetical protein [Leptospira santarosai]|uniref:Tetratricopeptide repeat protein n=1 Tax=Leptospira santarosai str. MOR084 TaxID=1049984 RepID=A0A0E2BEB5_9LEPT|nr:hypothetical protein [Leptospira santarosai]EKO33698.1 hypothetical protein LEP1GSC179_1343 [Leptospira santarosai str. MOR084]
MSLLTAENLRNRFQLPEEAIVDLLTAKYFDTKVAGRLRLGGESLEPIQLTYLNETEDEEKKNREPKQKLNGRYVCDALSLADCDYNDEDFFDGQIFVWIPSLRCFASWDCDHEQSYLFPGLTWETISKDPIPYLCAQWEPIEKGKNIWDLYELWTLFPYVTYASEFFKEPSSEVEAAFKTRNYSKVIKVCTETLRAAEQPLLNLHDLTTGKVELLCFRSISQFMTNEVESALDDFEEAISIAEQHDLVAVSRITHPNWYLNDVRQSFSVMSGSLKEKEQYNLFKTFLVELLRKQNKEVLNFVEIFRNRYPFALGDLLDHINSVVENKGELFHSSIRRIQSIS